MHRILTFVILLVHCTIFSGAYVQKWDVVKSRIVGGHEAVAHSHPYIVSLQLRILWARQHFCGGSIINKNSILTAAHCIKESWLIRWLPIDAVAGAHNVERISAQAQVVNINERIAHPDYNGAIGPNDIAVLKTKESFNFNDNVKPINLPTYSKLNYNSLKLVGWGVLRTTVFFPDLPDKLQEVAVTYIPYEECYNAVDIVKEDNEDNPLDKTYHICTGPLTGGIAACNGDSGGPLVLSTSYKTIEMPNDPVEEITEENYEFTMDYNEFFETEDLRSNDKMIINEDQITSKEAVDDQIPVIVGIVSWGMSPCGEKGAPSVYTKVEPYLDFINKHI